MTGSVVVWDHKDDPPDEIGQVLCWQSYAGGGLVSSVPRYLEDHAGRLRAKYLAFVHDLGERRVHGRRVAEHLDMGEGFSIWWMTTLAEKSPFKSPRIYDCLRLLALEEILLDRKPSELLIHSADSALAQAVKRLCRNLGIAFVWKCGKRSRQEWSLGRIYRSLPYPLQGLISLRHIVVRWLFRKFERPRWFSGESAVFLCSYFVHLDLAACASGRFHSGFWEVLPQVLHDGGRRTNWIQHFQFGAAGPDPRTALGWLREYNHDAIRQGYHIFLDSYLTWKIVFRVLKNWCWLNAVTWRLRHIRSAFRPVGSAAWLWPLMRHDWLTSLCGPVAMGNCQWIELFDAALGDIPNQKTGFYLCENQGWERALLRAWRKHGHGRIVGVVHATVPFWHLYYFGDPRSLASKQACAMPLPDKWAVNGAVARIAFAEAGYPVEQLVDVEALRYLDLPQVQQMPAAAATRTGAAKPSVSGARGANVLVLGDMISASMRSFLSLLENTVGLLPPGYKFTFKPHPGCPVDLSGYPGLQAGETTAALHQILGEYDLVLSANCTSAAVDAYVAGVPVIIHMKGTALNLSPLRGQSGVHFVSAPSELAKAMQTATNSQSTNPGHREIYFLDPHLPRWRRLLDLEHG